jgi:drug/metabolite transporter (DMT)-like permease
MSSWFALTVAATFCWALWALGLKFSGSYNIPSSQSTTMTALANVILVVLTNYDSTLDQFLKVSTTGLFLSLAAGFATFFGKLFFWFIFVSIMQVCCRSFVNIFSGTHFFTKALEVPGASPSVVTALSSLYPVLVYIVCLFMGLESLSLMKLLGILLAVGSALCFSAS